MKMTKEDKIAVIQRGIARLPAMGEEAKWAFGGQLVHDFTVPPPWVRRVVLLKFGVDPDAAKASEPPDPLNTSKMLGSMVGLVEGAKILFQPNVAASITQSGPLDEERLKQCVASAAKPHISTFEENAGVVRQEYGQKTVEQFAAFTAGQNHAAQAIAAEEQEPGSTSDMTHDLLVFLWMYWPEIPTAGSVQKLHQWITDLGYLHCSEELVEKVCRKAQLRLSKRGRQPGIPTE
jgi:hypothetical protein